MKTLPKPAEFADQQTCLALSSRIAQKAVALQETVTIMEVCGTHTMSIARWALKSLLPDSVRLISGPGCPVCVTPPEVIDAVVRLAIDRKITVFSYGDMIRVKGDKWSLKDAREKGADVHVAFSPYESLEYARKHPGRDIVFFGVGFETTAPGAAVCLLSAEEQRIKNWSMVSAHKLVPPALRALLDDPAHSVQGFLLPGHVSTIVGTRPYHFVCDEYGIPGAISGFEPADILLALNNLLDQRLEKRAEIANCYPRAVSMDGNVRALHVLYKTFEPEDSRWRGLGEIRSSQFGIRPEFAAYDAAEKYDLDFPPMTEPPGCCCGSVLAGKTQPEDCPLFATVCTPDSAIGPCMVSSEGSCAAAFKFGGRT